MLSEQDERLASYETAMAASVVTTSVRCDRRKDLCDHARNHKIIGNGLFNLIRTGGAKGPQTPDPHSQSGYRRCLICLVSGLALLKGFLAVGSRG